MSRRRHDERRTLLLGVALALVAVALLAVAVRAPTGLPGRTTTTVHVQLRDLANLPPRGAEVRIAGRRVGQTLDARREAGRPTLSLQLDGDVPALPADTTVRIRLRSLVGAQYVEVTPGTSTRVLRDGDTIDVRRTSAAVQLPGVLDAFDPPTRDALRNVLRGTSTGLAGRGADIGDALAVLHGVARDTSAVVGAVLDRPGSVSALVRSARRLAAALEPVGGDLAAGVGEGADALTPVAEEQPALDQALRVAPGVLADTRGHLDRTNRVLRSAARFSRATADLSGALPPTLEATDAFLRDTRPGLRALSGILRRARPALAPTDRALRALHPALPRITATLDAAGPPVRTVAAHGCDLSGFVRNWRSFLGYAPPGQSGLLGPSNVLRILAGDSNPSLDPRRLGAQEAYLPPCRTRGTSEAAR